MASPILSRGVRSKPTEDNPAEGTAAKPETEGALVIGANYRALGLVRSLGRRGVPVWVLKQHAEVLAATSRYAGRTLIWPPGEDHKKVDFLLDAASRHAIQGWLLFPTDDESAALVARHHATLSQCFQLTTPAWDVLRWAYNKRLTYEMAQQVGVAYPWTFYPHGRDDLLSLDCPFPAIIKPAFKQGRNRLTTAKAWRVDDRASLLARYDEARTLVALETLMIQELVPGSGETQFSYAALVKDGQPLASLVARRTRQIPIDFGKFSTLVETVDEPAIVEPARRLLAAMRFTGVIEVEFKRDPRDGIFKLLDINPRVWGWHTLCARAGVDFTYLLCRMIQGQDVPKVTARPGVKWVFPTADFPAAISEILRGRLSLGSYARSLRGPRESAIFASDDPWPSLLEWPLLSYTRARRLISGKAI